MNDLSAICPSTGEYCDTRQFCVSAGNYWVEASATAEEILKQRERISSSIFGLPFRLIGVDVAGSAREQVQNGRDMAINYVAILLRPREASTADECDIPTMLDQVR